MASNTASYNFLLPTVGGDTNLWGGYLNSNWEDVDDLFDGTTPVVGIDIDGGTIDGTPIGLTTPSTGAFSTLDVSGASTFAGIVGFDNTVDFNDDVTFNAGLTTLQAGVTFDLATGFNFATLKSNDDGVSLALRGAAGFARQLAFLTGGDERWTISANNSAEIGGEEGSDFEIARWDDAGSFLDTPFKIERLSGNVTFLYDIIVTGEIDGDLAATSELLDGVIATTQGLGDASTKVATTEFVANELAELGAPSITLLATGDKGSTSSTTHTYSAVSIGAADEDRNILVIASFSDGSGGANSALSSVTIDGDAMLLVANTSDAPSIHAAYRHVPAGTSVEFIFNYSVAVSGHTIAIFDVRNIKRSPGSVYNTTDGLTSTRNTSSAFVQVGDTAYNKNSLYIMAAHFDVDEDVTWSVNAGLDVLTLTEIADVSNTTRGARLNVQYAIPDQPYGGLATRRAAVTTGAFRAVMNVSLT